MNSAESAFQYGERLFFCQYNSIIVAQTEDQEWYDTYTSLRKESHMNHNLTVDQQQKYMELREKVLFEARMYHLSKSRLTLGVLEKGLAELSCFEKTHHLPSPLLGLKDQWMPDKQVAFQHKSEAAPL